MSDESPILYEVVQGDDWIIPVTALDSEGVVENWAGYMPEATLFHRAGQVECTVGNSRILFADSNTDPTFTIVIPKDITAIVAPDHEFCRPVRSVVVGVTIRLGTPLDPAHLAERFRTRIQIRPIDSLGHQATRGYLYLSVRPR